MDLKIMGSGDATGGIYENVKIMGSGNITGDVECVSYSVMGSGDLHGNLKAQFLKINGSGDIEGNVYADEIIINGSGDLMKNVECRFLKINGSGDVCGDVRSDEIMISGSGNIEGNVRSEQVIISGSGEIEGNCECEKFIGKGSFTVGGFLNSEEVEITLSSSCEIEEIGASKVTVTRGDQFRKGEHFTGGGFFNKVLKFATSMAGTLECRVIEANEIYLENTEVDIVRGDTVIIGEGCEIGTIEYRDVCEINPKSSVDKVIKIGNSNNEITVI